MNKISICTVCMNRLTYLRETLPLNIEENRHYPGIEFILLDYNSRDNMENWARIHMADYIASGLLKYYKTTEPEYFLLSHSKNMAMRLATGDIVCMVDADNFAGPGYAHWVNEVFTKQGNTTIITTLEKADIPYGDQGGKLCFDRSMLHTSRGFDESLVGYGVEDLDLVNRLEKMGGTRVFIRDKKYLKFIGHTDVERVKNFHFVNNLRDIYVNVSHSMNTRNSVLYFLKDNSFLNIEFEFDESLKQNPVLSLVGWTVRREGEKTGTFQGSAGAMTLTYADESSSMVHFDVQPQGFLHARKDSEPNVWKRIQKEDVLYFRLIKSYTECVNRRKYMENDKAGTGVNLESWGKGTVYQNFDYSRPISLS
ncbi:MAG: glycosyltransferase [Bacteroidetes bacterium]|nr:glycosyltransferase [Bacteroidota bacterium]